VRRPGTVARPMPRGAPAIPPRIVDLFSTLSAEMGTTPKPRTSAALRSLDRTEWEQLADSIDWREKDGSKLLTAFRASLRSKLAGDGLRKALGYADQLAMTPDQRALTPDRLSRAGSSASKCCAALSIVGSGNGWSICSTR
jgi:hypothetical protein